MDDGSVVGHLRPGRPAVLYHDYNGLAYPLSELYWSSSSGVLVSRHPLSCIEEIISMYCPHCLTRFMEEESRNYQNSCPSCFQCPRCCSVLVPTTLGAGVVLACSTCMYRSDACGLMGADKQEIDALALEKERESRAGDAFAKMLAQLQLLDATSPSSSSSSSAQPPPPPPPTTTTTPAAAAATAAATNNAPTLLTTNDVDILDCRQRAALYPSHSHNARLIKDCLPRRLRLRSKRTLRCRLDVEKGKMSIIAQPKTFPLEGDSSLKIQRGKWWVKDASAIHEIPRVVLTKLPTVDASAPPPSVSFLHLEVSNPKDVAVQVFLALSAATGLEPSAPTPNGEALKFSLGAFEDELLREVDQDASEDHTPGGGGAELTGLLPIDSMPSGWVHSTAHNVATVIIPLHGYKPAHSLLDASKSSMTIAMTVSTDSLTRQVLLQILI